MICRHCNNYNDDRADLCVYCGAELFKYPSKKKNYTKIIALTAGILVALICLAVGIILLNKKSTQKKYDEKINTANKYLAVLDYDSAIQAYNEAIDIDDKNEEAYIQLAYIYEELDEDEKLYDILTCGYQCTHSTRIKGMLNNLLLYGSIFERADSTQEVQVDNKSEVLPNEEYFNNILNKGYEDYVEAYGTGNIVKQSGGDVVCITFTGFSGELYYVNADTEIVDKSNGIPNGNVKPSYIVASDMSCIFTGFESVVEYTEICEIFNESPQIKQEAGKYYLILHYQGCEINLECDSNGNVAEKAANKIKIPGAGEGTGNVLNGGYASGKIIDASTGQGIANVNLTFREGHDNQYGAIIDNISTDAQGNYTIELSSGWYTVCAEADGFNTEYFEVNVQKGITMANQNLTMSGHLNTGEVRIVLEWGAMPNDLDSHLWGDVGGNSFHVYYANQTYQDIAMLDVDDRSAYGPETITIKDCSTGTFTYGVQDFENYDLGSSNTQLGISGATVKVYMPGESQPVIFNVPAGNGAYWEVFKIENGSLFEINQLKAGAEY